MLCQNCGKNEVTFHYTQVINGVKKEMALCDKCAKNLGLKSLDFNMPINMSSFLGDFFNVASDTDFLPNYIKPTTLMCDNCKMTYDEFINTGKFGCKHCYDIFEGKLDPVLKNIHGSSNHVGRRAKLISKEENVEKEAKKQVNKTTTSKKVTSNSDKKSQDNKEKLEKLNNDLKLAIKEERYEDAAKIRDEIKKIK